MLVEETRIHGVTWILFDEVANVLLERCPKKARVLGVGEWFVPGGKVARFETPSQTLVREVREEWGVGVNAFEPLPLVEGSAVPAGEQGIFLMRPYVITVHDPPPSKTVDEDVPLRWFSHEEALHSPVPQVRMMVAAAMCIVEQKLLEGLKR